MNTDLNRICKPGLVVVVGGRGVIGSAIVEKLQAEGTPVVVVSHDPKIACKPGMRYGDLRYPETLKAAVSGADVVIQSATFPTYPIEKAKKRHTFGDFDGLGTTRLVAAARAAGVRRYLFISGVGTKPNSDKPYFQALWQGEEAVRNSTLEAVCLRPALVYGPRDRGLNRVVTFARRFGWIPVIGDGEAIHQPVYVNDLANIASMAIAPVASQGTFEAGGPARMTLNAMLRTVVASAGLRASLVHIPHGLARFGGWVMEKLPGPISTRAAVDFLSENFVADVAPLLGAFAVVLTRFEDEIWNSIRGQNGQLVR